MTEATVTAAGNQERETLESITSGNSNGQRTFSHEELTEILKHAEISHEVSKIKRQQRDVRRIEDSLPTILPSGREHYNVSTAYEMADTLGIPHNYIDNAINALCPSREAKIRDLIDLGAEPTFQLKIQTYEKSLKRVVREYANALETKLKETYPHDSFSVELKRTKEKRGYYHPYWDVDFYKESEIIVPWLFGLKQRKKQKREFLGQVTIGYLIQYNGYSHRFDKCNENDLLNKNFQIGVHLHSPIFTHAVKEIIQQLNERFKKQIRDSKVFQFYEVE